MVNKLFVLRAERRISQDELARQLRERGLDISRNRVVRIERDYTDPTDAEIDALCDLWNLQREEIFPPAAAATSPAASQEASR